MNVDEHLFTCLGEEGAEVAQAVSKILRFGTTDKYPEGEEKLTTVEKLVRELNEVIAAADILADCGLIPKDWHRQELVDAKRHKIRKYLEYARERGTVTDYPLP